MTTYGAALAAGRTALRKAGIDSAALDARLLMAHAAGLDAASLLARGGDEMPALAEAWFDRHVHQRLGGMPVSRILGEREFWELPLTIGPATLDPRPDTEVLVESVLAAAGPRRSAALTICDLGTGSGAILIALLTELPSAVGLAVDISEAALALARINAKRHGVLTRIGFHHGDYAEGPSGSFDIVVSNPPYIESAAIAGLAPEVREHDPRPALDGGPDGLAAYRAILARAGTLLAPGGLMAFEVGFDAGEAVASLCREAGLREIEIRGDLAGHDRVVLARRNVSEIRQNGAKKALGNFAISG